MAREANYYDLLDLSPELDPVRDREAILTKIKKKQQEWSRGNLPPSQSIRAELGLSLIKKMRSSLDQDIARWRSDAKAQTDSQEELQTEAAETFREFFRVYKRNEISKDMLQRVEKISKYKITDVSILLDLNVKVVEPKPQQQKAVKIQLSLSMLKQALRLIHELGYTSLYDILCLNADLVYDKNSSCEDLKQRARDILGAGRRGEKWVTTHLTELVGIAVQCFDNISVKQDYDRWSLGQSLNCYANMLQVFKTIGYIMPDQYRELVTLAAGKAGLSVNNVQPLVDELLAAAGVVSLASESREVPMLPICMSCGYINKQGARKCSHCSTSLTRDCFNCGRAMMVEIHTCTYCHTTVRAGQIAETLRAQAEVLLETGDMISAQVELEKAIGLAPSNKKLVELRARVGKQYRQNTEFLSQIKQHISNGRVNLAQRELDQNIGHIPSEIWLSLKKELAEIKAKFNIQMNEADTALTSGRTLDAYRVVRHALTLISDDERTDEMLKLIQPPAPHSIEASVSMLNVQLSWVPAMNTISSLEYLIIRSYDRSVSGARDGTVVYEGTATRFTDTECPNGKPVYYAVFNRLGNSLSARPAVTGKPVFLMRPVTGLAAVLRDKAIMLSWTLPGNAVDAVVCRMAIDQKPDTLPVHSPTGSGKSGWLDCDPVKDQRMLYAVYARYSDTPDATPGYSLPSSTDAMAVDIPSRLDQANLTLADGRGVLEWSARSSKDEIDEVWIFKTRPQIINQPIVMNNDLQEPYRILSCDSGSRLEIDQQCFGTLWYVVTRRRGDVYSLSAAKEWTTRPELQAFTARQKGDNVVVSWEWPNGCSRAMIKVGNNPEKIYFKKQSGARAIAKIPVYAPEGSVPVKGWTTSDDGTLKSSGSCLDVIYRKPVVINYVMESQAKHTLAGKLGISSGSQRTILHCRLDKPGYVPAFQVLFSENQFSVSDKSEVLWCFAGGKMQHAEFQKDLKDEIKGRRGYVSISFQGDQANESTDRATPNGGIQGGRTY